MPVHVLSPLQHRLSCAQLTTLPVVNVLTRLSRSSIIVPVVSNRKYTSAFLSLKLTSRLFCSDSPTSSWWMIVWLVVVEKGFPSRLSTALGMPSQSTSAPVPSVHPVTGPVIVGDGQ